MSTYLFCLRDLLTGCSCQQRCLNKFVLVDIQARCVLHQTVPRLKAYCLLSPTSLTDSSCKEVCCKCTSILCSMLMYQWERIRLYCWKVFWFLFVELCFPKETLITWQCVKPLCSICCVFFEKFGRCSAFLVFFLILFFNSIA